MYVLRITRKAPQNRPGSHDKAAGWFSERATAGQRGAVQGWTVTKIDKRDVIHSDDCHTFSYDLTFEKTKGRRTNEGVVDGQWMAIVEVVQKCARNTKWQKHLWDVSFPKPGDEEPSVEKPAPDGKAEISDPKVKHGVKNVATQQFYELKPQWDGVFDEIYELDPQIQVLTQSLDAFLDSGHGVRGHSLCLGPPGCGKTTVTETLCSALGEEDVAYFRMDATSTTKAGIERKLLESEVVPPIMLIEELEKVENTGILKFLLGLLDDRAEVNKMNARIGHQRRKLNLLCLATVNDMDKLANSHAGSVASRFSNQIYFPRPSRETVGRILEREIEAKYGDAGNMDWVEPTLKYVYDEEKNTDPRRAKTVCLVGRDLLLNGQYQDTLRATRAPKWDKGEGDDDAN